MSTTETTGGAAGPTSTRILIVEDDPSISELLAEILRGEQFAIERAYDGETAVSLARSFQPALIVLDLMLPKLDGIEVCRQVRTFSDTFIIMLTSRSDEVDKLIGLSVGADDYMTKPFSPRELVARIRTVLRRRRVSGVDEVAKTRRIGDLELDPDAREATLAGKELSLTPHEFDLLDTLTSRPRMAFSRQQLLDRVWGPGWIGDERVVDVHIGRLRQKVEEKPSEPKYIRTIRGVGYRMGTGD